ncbi:P-loop containing nucleoside triphosphate hydrolase protein [Pisolithus tinctorius]|nr:P-loop containing nucleoside triphosphate hydrolase protein [Pisolithus tinctorius]
MAKRRVAVDSDDEDPQSSQASKRARTQDSEVQQLEEFTSQTPEKKPKVNGKTKDEGNSSDEGEIDIRDANEEGEEFEKRFEEENGDAIRRRLEARSQVVGGIADHGIIECIEMANFMCHPRLRFTFGPQINFIIGHNGSGKSAVLSAITIALGGKTISTGRGSGLKSFIREGQNKAEVTITLKNQGEEAYRPKDYGKSIVITRTFTRQGSSTWSIKSKDGKKISDKRDELAAICDHMNIQVDNPLNVLTQDAARQFLSASHPSDKYKFFLRGTQLSQLSEEYDLCLAHVNQTRKILHQKKQALPELRAAFKEATVRFEEASKAREQRHKADELKKELAWAHVAAKQHEMEAKFQEVAKAQQRLPRIQEKVDGAEAQFKAASDEVERLEREFADLGNIDHLNQKAKELQDNMRVNKNSLNQFKNDERDMSASLTGLNKAIQEYDIKIVEETRRMETHTLARREELNRRLEEAKQAVAAAEQAHGKVCDEKRAKLTATDDCKQKGMAAQNQMKQAQERIQECNTMINRCKDRQDNVLAPYGKDMKNILEQIKQMRWHGDTPIGPLGLHVRLKDQTWAPLLRSQLGTLMSAFACTDPRDRPQLKRLFDQTRNHHINIIISERDEFDYSSGEPPANVLTVLRALEISDPYVLRILINQSNIERTILGHNRKAGDDILLGLRSGVAWTADFMRVTRYSEGGGSSIKLNRIANADPRQMLFTATDNATELRDWQERLRVAETTYQSASAECKRLMEMYNMITQESRTLDQRERAALENLRKFKTAHSQLQDEANEEMPAGVTHLQTAKEEAEEEKKLILQQFEDLARRKTAINETQNGLLTELNQVKKQIRNFEETRGQITTNVEEAVTKRLDAQKNRSHYTKKLEDEQRTVRDLEAVADTLQQEFTDWTARAREYCDPVENPRKVAVVQRQLESVQTALKERERRQGASVEEMTIEVNKAKADLDNAEHDLRTCAALNNTIKKSLVLRLDKWHEFRRHIALRCKLVFQYHLSNRGYYGKVLFDHVNQTLQLKVQTDDQAATQGRDKDPRSLSGGEKSFSTICLLLSLWDSIGCPLRCLDEFDVFMDAVNRRISMRMMIDTANASDKKQYILITPQEMGSVVVGPTVRVHRMSDPERGQGVLAFGNASA